MYFAGLLQKVSANESMLMEMDEIITQIRLWRSTISLPEESEIEGEGTNVEYTSTAYDRLFHSEIVHPEGPECEEEPSSGKFVHIADIDMAAKVMSYVACFILLSLYFTLLYLFLISGRCIEHHSLSRYRA